MRDAATAARKPPSVPPLAVTMGDPAGIGPDIVVASWSSRSKHRLPSFVIYGDARVLEQRARTLGLHVPVAEIANVSETAHAFATALPVLPIAARDTDRQVIAGIESATADVIAGRALALVTNPIAKKSLSSISLEYPGHTAFLGLLAARHTGQHFRPIMMLASDELKVVPATVHIPLSAVPSTLSTSLLADTLRITASALATDFGIANPRIAVAGLNPHAGEGGLIGTEEAGIITPAIILAAAEGIAVTGPHSADTLFHAEARATYDAVVAMYHDQALIPLKTLAFDRGVNVTLGLPFVRTSPDHGTAYALAGTGKARPLSFIAALRMASELAHRRVAAGHAGQAHR
jgi:4-hydroxythreonine-4-phosphate dehydrogenase